MWNHQSFKLNLNSYSVLFFAANGGRGTPVFAGETDCTYYFDWETAYACVKEKEDLLCRVRDGNKHYDLSPLTRSLGEFKSSFHRAKFLCFDCCAVIALLWQYSLSTEHLFAVFCSQMLVRTGRPWTLNLQSRTHVSTWMFVTKSCGQELLPAAQWTPPSVPWVRVSTRMCVVQEWREVKELKTVSKFTTILN